MPEPYLPLVPTTKVAGRVAAIPKGPWNSTTQYQKLDIVSHDYRSYMAKKASKNHEPIGTDDEYWMMLVESLVRDFIGATEETSGHNGTVPTPEAGEQHKVLRGDGDWGPKLEMDVVKQGDLYGYLNANDEFVAFQSQEDVVRIITELLVPEDAKEALDTLKEIADWIQDHPDDAAQMHANIEDLYDITYKKTGGTIDGDVKITGDLEVNGDVKLDNPLEIQYGGTSANNAHDARVNLNVLGNDNIAPVEDDLIANRAYAVGEHFILDDQLYLVTAPIFRGDDIKVGDESANNNVLVIDIVNVNPTIPTHISGSSNDSSDDGSDDEGTEPVLSDLTIKTTTKTVIFEGVGSGFESVFPLSVNLLDNPHIDPALPYAFSSDSGYSAEGISIVPKFMLYNDDELVDTVDSFVLNEYPSVDEIRPVYIYTITGPIDLVLSPKVHILSGYYNCTISETIEDQIKNLNEHGVIMTGASSTEDGVAGYVPAPVAGDNKRVLKGDGTFDQVDLTDEVKGILAVENGGTGADNSEDALNNLGAVPDEMVASTETSNISSRAYGIGNQFIWNNVLYKVIDTIAIGDELQNGINIELADTIVRQIHSISAVGTTFVGATENEDGEMGLVPAPIAGDQEKVLTGDGNWDKISRNFVGTMGEWDALPLSEKIRYETADILPEYIVTVEKDIHVDEVILTPASTNNGYGYGRVVTVTATATEGYEIVSGTGEYVITEDTTITVLTDIQHLKLTVTKDEHVVDYEVSPQPNPDGEYDYGTVVTITATTDEHYHITAGTGQVTITGATTVNITSSIDQFTVTVDADGGVDSVRFSPSAPNNVYDYGTTITAIPTLKPGYDLISGAGEYTVLDDMTVTIVSQIQTYTLTATQGEHVASIVFSPEPVEGKYDYGTVVTVTATADEHYHITGGTGEYTITEDTEITVSAAIDRFSLTTIGDDGVDTISLSPESADGEYDYGTEVTVAATAIEHYEVIAGTGSYTITEDTTVNIASRLQRFTLSVDTHECVEDVTFSPAPINNDGTANNYYWVSDSHYECLYEYGTVVTVTPNVDHDYISQYELDEDGYEITVTEDTSLEVTAHLKRYRLDISIDAGVDHIEFIPAPLNEDYNQSANMLYNCVYEYGSRVTYTVVPKEGYEVDDDEENEIEIIQDETATVTTSVIQCTLTLKWGDHVTDTYALPTANSSGASGLAKYYTYDYGTSVNIISQPDTGYEIDGGNVQTIVIKSDFEMTVTASIIKCTLIVNADSNVEDVIFSPEPVNGKFDYGTVVTVTAVAADGYEIASGTGEYTMTEDRTIEITSQLAPIIFTSASPFSLAVAEPGWDGTIEYSTDNETWTVWDGTEIAASANDLLYLRGSNNTKLYNNSYDNKFIFTGTDCIGNIEMLLDYETVYNDEHPSMANGCFHSIFENCSNLVKAPKLPATTLAEECYYSMFAGCTSLALAPSLPASELTSYCYAYMFSNCTSLTTPPPLLSETLAEGCYDSMFVNCSSLTTLPALPATELAEDCYEEMFLNCTSIKLSKTPSDEYAYEYRIPAISSGVNVGSLRRMFYNTGGSFTGTPSINVMYYTNNEPISTDSFIVTATGDSGVDTVTLSPEMVNNVYTYGTVVTVVATPKDGFKIVSGTGKYTVTKSMDISVETELVALKFSSDDIFKLSVENHGWNGTVEYTTDDGESWARWDGSELTGDADNDIYLRGTGNLYITGTSEVDQLFTFTGKYCTGNIETLLDYQTVIAGGHPPMDTEAFESMFENCTSLVKAPDLPSVTLADNCYYYMFYNCISLIEPPALPATSLVDCCYADMFNGCISLTSMPLLPATIVNTDCYASMFKNCTSLKISEIQTGEYQYPFSIISDDPDYLVDMFENTGGTFTGTPIPETTYYTTNPLIS